ncbi:MAG: peptidyl-prolyl cis-trans isomerase [Polyangiaceae bacterium]|nr:peptidyl-prolyl cis-trans isomerase [Polyangiaceae bacterium]
MSQRVPRVSPWWLPTVFVGCLGVTGCSACEDEKAAEPGPALTKGSRQLTKEQAAQVLARVGDHAITLGEYQAVLERMDRFERLRYQSPDRRADLLNEIIDVELLAEEARRRGLDKRLETQQRMQQVLREEMLRAVRSRVPGPDQIAADEVRRYYSEHKQEFFEPERRRVAHIVMGQRAKAEQVLKEALAASPEQWGQLVRRHSLDRAPAGQELPAELAGDMGIVTRPGSHGAQATVPAAIVAAVFSIDKTGGVFGQLVEVDGKLHVVRMIGKSDARQRSYQEAERAVRVALVRRRVREAEAALEQELRKKYPVSIDQAALKQIEVDLGR